MDEHIFQSEWLEIIKGDIRTLESACAVCVVESAGDMYVAPEQLTPCNDSKGEVHLARKTPRRP